MTGRTSTVYMRQDTRKPADCSACRCDSVKVESRRNRETASVDRLRFRDSFFSVRRSNHPPATIPARVRYWHRITLVSGIDYLAHFQFPSRKTAVQADRELHDPQRIGDLAVNVRRAAGIGFAHRADQKVRDPP